MILSSEPDLHSETEFDLSIERVQDFCTYADNGGDCLPQHAYPLQITQRSRMQTGLQTMVQSVLRRDMETCMVL
jgi:hypothetical protein